MQDQYQFIFDEELRRYRTIEKRQQISQRNNIMAFSS
jgi:hypothetical protein